MNIYRLAVLLFGMSCFTLHGKLSESDLAKLVDLPVENTRKIVAEIKQNQKTRERWWGHYYHLLPGIIKRFNLKVGCEVGVAFGGHSEALLKNTAIDILYSIDPYQHFSEDIYQDSFNLSQKKFDLLYHLVQERLNPFGERSKLLRMTSVEASKLFKDNQLDFVFIDANHLYESVMEDLNTWFGKVRSGGFLTGDDYLDSKHPGVKKAVDEFFKEKGLTVYFDPKVKLFWWVQKPMSE